jgi:hypothetical protein
MVAVQAGDLLVAVDGHAFRHPDGLYRVRGGDILGSKVRLMIERQGIPPFECTLVRDAFPAVQIKAKIFAKLDKLILLVSEDMGTYRHDGNANRNDIIKIGASRLEEEHDKENVGNSKSKRGNFKDANTSNGRKLSGNNKRDNNFYATDKTEADTNNIADVSTISETAEELAAVRFMVCCVSVAPAPSLCLFSRHFFFSFPAIIMSFMLPSMDRAHDT